MEIPEELFNNQDACDFIRSTVRGHNIDMASTISIYINYHMHYEQALEVAVYLLDRGIVYPKVLKVLDALDYNLPF